MNELGISLIWLAAQVTLLCLITAAIYFIARRRYPAAGATAMLTGLTLTIVLTFAMFSPWPRWSFETDSFPTPPARAAADKRGSDNERAGVAAADAKASARSTSEAGDAAPQEDVHLESPLTAALTAFGRGLRDELSQPSLQRADAAYRWPAWLAVALLVVMTLGAVRLLAGWLSVRGCIRRSRAIVDRSLNETVDVLRAEIGCHRNVELRESADIASAATIGWRKPVILLPPGWRNWSESERRVVLAHELAHVTAGDAATWLMAQFGLLLHFYHPLVHWLTHRLRLEQELAADALAARLTGSSQTYLTTLAELAVRQPDRPVAWPARAFLPTRGTLLRRLEMLRDTKTPPLRSSNFRRGTVIALTLAAGVLVAGLRPPQAERAAAQERDTAAQSAANPKVSEGRGFNLENVPVSTILLVGARPASLAKRLEIQPLASLIDELLQSEKTGIHTTDIDQFLLYTINSRDPHSPDANLQQDGPEQFVPTHLLEIRMTQPTNFAKYIEAHQPSFGKFAEAIKADDRTLLIGDRDAVNQVIKTRERGQQQLKWRERFQSMANDSICLVWNLASCRPMIQQQFEKQPNPFVGMFAPLWQKTELIIGGAKVDDRLTLSVNGWAADAEDAAKLEKTLTSLVPFATGLLETAKASAKQAPPDTQGLAEKAIGLAQYALDNCKVELTDDRVTVTVEGETGSAAKLAAAMVPAITQAREAARHTQSKNNLKQIGLAFHNFHDVYGHFPPPVLYGRTGGGKSKHPHSWRVAILPFVEASDLYDQYRFDEPWDSEHNKQIMEKMPAVFRSPNDDEDSLNAAYYVLVGEDTAVGDKPEPDGNPTKGVSIRDIFDGTSNTLLAVEAKRDIPWTKPEDIPYSADAAIPDFGGWHAGGFHALFGDGSVRFVSEKINETPLRSMITRNGGEVVNIQ